MTDRQSDLDHFYEILAELEGRLGGRRTLAQCDGRMDWPERGVYLFFEPGETRTMRSLAHRVVRVGTHALKDGSRTSLWNRLSQHRGTLRNPGGNHRGSVFRKHIGKALLLREPTLDYPTWGERNSASSEIRHREQPMEALVSDLLGDMPFLWLSIDDAAGRGSLRGYIERNSIALLSNFRKAPVDPPSLQWLGHHCPSERVQKSGLWNSNHVDENYDDTFLETLEGLVARQGVT